MSSEATEAPEQTPPKSFDLNSLPIRTPDQIPEHELPPDFLKNQEMGEPNPYDTPKAPILPHVSFITSMVRHIQNICFIQGFFGITEQFLSIEQQSVVVAFALRELVDLSQQPTDTIHNPITIEYGTRKLHTVPDAVAGDPSTDSDARLNVKYFWPVLNELDPIDPLFYAFVEYYGFPQEAIQKFKYHKHDSESTTYDTNTKWLVFRNEFFIDPTQNHFAMRFFELLTNHYEPIGCWNVTNTSYSDSVQTLMGVCECLYDTVASQSSTNNTTTKNTKKIISKNGAVKSIKSNTLIKSEPVPLELVAYSNRVGTDKELCTQFGRLLLKQLQAQFRYTHFYLLRVYAFDRKTDIEIGETLLLEFPSALNVITIDLKHYLCTAMNFKSRDPFKKSLYAQNVRYDLGTFDRKQKQLVAE